VRFPPYPVEALASPVRLIIRLTTEFVLVVKSSISGYLFRKNPEDLIRKCLADRFNTFEIQDYRLESIYSR
jgi:hypothetical protein